jgi:hypothetical protein
MLLHRSPILLLTACCFALLAGGCGYRVGNGEGLPACYSSISVPYVDGDMEGYLTAAIVKEIVRSGAFQYRYCGGSLILNVTQLDIDEDNIGFRYDRRKRGTLTSDIIPTETRMTILVEVSVTDAASCCTVLGPVQLSASVDYDHDYYSSRDGVNIFSLGQLSDLDEAYDAAQTPLNRTIARKIVDYITQSW